MRLHLPGDDARRRLLWGYLVGAAAGAVAGLAGGAGGRIAMLVLRLANPEVAGATSDDGFEMGQITPATFGLLAGTAAIGAVSGAFYVLLRSSMPARFRAALWSCFAAAAGGAAFVHEGGSDFGLDPVWFGIASFVLLPGLAALAVVVLVERWITCEGPSRRFAALLVAAALAGTLGSLVAAVLCAGSLAWRHVPDIVRAPVELTARIAVPVLLVGRTLYDGLDLAHTAAALL